MTEAKQTKICPKCSQQMEEGYIPDRGYRNDTANFPVWVSGQPEKRFLGGLDLDGKTTLNIITFRCFACGFLESYAQE
jgi:hypothetical protein